MITNENVHRCVSRINWDSICNVTRKFPELTDYGIGIYQSGSSQVTQEERTALIQEQQKFLFENCKGEIAMSLAFLRCFTPTMRIGDDSTTSYYMKHQMEDVAYALNFKRKYVCNGAFIAAAVIGNYRVSRVSKDSPNVRIGVPHKQVTKIVEFFKRASQSGFLEARDLE